MQIIVYNYSFPCGKVFKMTDYKGLVPVEKCLQKRRTQVDIIQQPVILFLLFTGFDGVDKIRKIYETALHKFVEHRLLKFKFAAGNQITAHGSFCKVLL